MKWINYLLTAVVIAGVMAGLGYFFSSAGGGIESLPTRPLVSAAIVMLLVVVLLPITIGGWKKLDEAQKEAQKWGWFWGAGLGLLLPLPVVLMCKFSGPGVVFGSGLSVEDGFVLGYGTVVVCICVCYGAAWLIFPAHWDPKLRIPRGQVVAAASIVSPKY